MPELTPELRADFLEWLRTGSFRGVQLEMNEFDVIQLLGNAVRVDVQENVVYDYGFGEFIFTRPENPENSDPDPLISRIQIDIPKYIRQFFEKSISLLTPEHVAKYLDSQGILHDYYHKSKIEWNFSYRKTRTANNINFIFEWNPKYAQYELSLIYQEFPVNETEKTYSVIFSFDNLHESIPANLSKAVSDLLDTNDYSYRGWSNVEVYVKATESELLNKLERFQELTIPDPRHKNISRRVRVEIKEIQS